LENNYYDIISMSYLFLSCTEELIMRFKKLFYIFSPSSLIFMANNKNLSVTGCNISKTSDTKL
ncbi:hypothetical protein, partial [Acinetobacter baumannii]|uniref:hypothetical protein n=1 Tax=Acinetobacter baumannii TaxID=470 RepID=UPI0021D4CC6C